MQFFQTPEPPEDVRQVVEAANHLHVSEFDLFRLAWQRWTGEEADEKAMERPFAAYMFNQVVPIWARHFSREVMHQATAGRLDRDAFGADRVRRRDPLPQQGRAYAWLPAAILGLFFLLVFLARYEPATEAPLACETGPGMRAFSQIAYVLGGRVPPDCLRE